MANRKIISYFSTKTYVVGTQKNRLNESFEHPKNMLNIWVGKYLQFYPENICLPKPVMEVGDGSSKIVDFKLH